MIIKIKKTENNLKLVFDGKEVGMSFKDGIRLIHEIDEVAKGFKTSSIFEVNEDAEAEDVTVDMKIEADLHAYGDGLAIHCLDKNCFYKHECAQHITAGDFRTEGGITPKLVVIEKMFGVELKECH